MFGKFLGAVMVMTLLIGQTQAASFVIPMEFAANAGDNVLVPIIVDDSLGLQGFNFDVTYDPAMLSLSNADVDLGQMLIDASGWQVIPNVDDSAGTAAMALFGVAPLGAGSGNVATLNFAVLDDAEGLSVITLTGPDNLGGIDMTYADGSISITAIPEPSTIVLSVMGILCLAAIARRRRVG